jgi:hypothetical protein
MVYGVLSVLGGTSLQFKVDAAASNIYTLRSELLH